MCSNHEAAAAAAAAHAQAQQQQVADQQVREHMLLDELDALTQQVPRLESEAAQLRLDVQAKVRSPTPNMHRLSDH